MGENHSDDPEFIYTMEKSIGEDGKLYPKVNEFNNEIGGYVYVNTTGASALYVPTSGQIVHLRTLTVCATGASGATLKLIDGPLATLLTNRVFVKIASGAGVDRMVHLEGFKGPLFALAPFAVASRKGMHVTWTGILDPNMPSV